MLKLTAEQMHKASHLADRIYQCERAKDSKDGEYGIETHAAIQPIPVGKDVLFSAANAEIARCHEELKAMGISLMPSVSSKSPLGSRICVGEVTHIEATDDGPKLWIGGKRPF